jgi:hypothetical protein
MKTPLKIWNWAILGIILTAGSAGAQYGPPTPQTGVPSDSNQARFMCELVNNQYTVTYHPVDRPNDKYPWAVPSTMGSNWNANRRCTEIARRLEEYRRDGLKELRTDIKNQYDIVCVTTERNNECRIVFTVPTGKDAIVTRDSVFRNLTMADSGQQTVGVNTFAEGNNNNFGSMLGNILSGGGFGGSTPTSSPAVKPIKNKDSIDLRPFLSTQDGGTGAQLRPRAAANSSTGVGKKLNPDRFRSIK